MNFLINLSIHFFIKCTNKINGIILKRFPRLKLVDFLRWGLQHIIVCTVLNDSNSIFLRRFLCFLLDFWRYFFCLIILPNESPRHCGYHPVNMHTLAGKLTSAVEKHHRKSEEKFKLSQSKLNFCCVEEIIK